MERYTFTQVHKFHQDYLKNNKRKKVELQTFKVSGGLKFWDKPHNERAAGQRKRHIVIFNEEKKRKLKFKPHFI
ncbi:hypothetical protein ACI2OX_03825 [Bacillus sp. N9]